MYQNGAGVKRMYGAVS